MNNKENDVDRFEPQRLGSCHKAENLLQFCSILLGVQLPFVTSLFKRNNTEISIGVGWRVLRR